jgi:hypothetical protein
MVSAQVITEPSTARECRAQQVATHRRELSRAIQRCFFCRQPVSVRDGWLEFYSDWGGGKLGYPTSDARALPVAHFTHTNCGPDGGYPIELKRCENVDAQWGWLQHIREKTWCSNTYLHALILAQRHVLAEAEHARTKRRRTRKPSPR